jgi:hypothetical protein
MLCLHVWLLLVRLRAEGADGKALAQVLYDEFQDDVEKRARAAGVKVRRRSGALGHGGVDQAGPKPDTTLGTKLGGFGRERKKQHAKISPRCCLCCSRVGLPGCT